MDLKWIQWFLLSFKGRINRAPFVFFNILLSFIYMLLLGAIGTEEPGAEEKAAIVMVAFLLWPSLAVQAKRWHDIDKSAWFILFNLIPLGAVVTFVINALLIGTKGPNRFGNDPLDGKPRVFEGRSLDPGELKALLGIGIVIMLCILSYAIYIYFLS